MSVVVAKLRLHLGKKVQQHFSIKYFIAKNDKYMLFGCFAKKITTCNLQLAIRQKPSCRLLITALAPHILIR